MEKIKEISVFFPAYNEEKNIEKTVLLANKVLERVAEEYEIIVVDDGSKDKTKEIVKKLSDENDKIRLVEHKINRGYGGALKTGFKNCKYKWMVFTDSDGQFDFSEFPNFLATQRKTKADLVIGYYKKRKVSFKRKLSTFVWQLIVRILFGLKVKSIDCGFKLIRKKVIDSMVLESERGAFISTEFLVKAKEKKNKIVEIPVSHYERKEGEATGSDWKVILNSFKDLYKLKKRFLLFSFVGLTSALTSLLIFNLFFWIGFSFVLSMVIGIVFSLAYNFLMNRNITFSAKNMNIKKQISRYLVVYFISQGINLFVSTVIKSLIGKGFLLTNLAVVTGIAVSVPFSFIGSLLWAFKKKGEENKIFKIMEEG